MVSNSAGDQSTTWGGSGSRGKRGMRQRAEEHGGSLDYRHRADGGFEVRAWFPIPENAGSRSLSLMTKSLSAAASG